MGATAVATDETATDAAATDGWPAPRPTESPSIEGDSDDAPVPALSPGAQLVRGVCVTVAIVLIAFLAQLTLVSRFQHAAAQQRAFEQFRGELATGTAPIGPTDRDGEVLPEGTPVALIEIPAIGVEEIVLEGTRAAVLYDGPGHRVDTVLPGQAGVSLIMGRRAAYGGPFGRLDELAAGDTITVTTGQGTFEFTVIGTRREGDPLPALLAPGSSRVTLATAAGTPFVPDGVLRVDADLDGEAVIGPPRLLASSALSPSEQPMGADRSSLWRLAMWLQAVLVVSLAAVWCWHRWHRAKTWVVFAPVLTVVGLATAGEVARHLPNLL